MRKPRGGHAFRVIAAYERWFAGEGKAPELLAALRLLGFFDRPATPENLAALRAAPAIAGLTEALIDPGNPPVGMPPSNACKTCVCGARRGTPAAWTPTPCCANTLPYPILSKEPARGLARRPPPAVPATQRQRASSPRRPDWPATAFIRRWCMVVGRFAKRRSMRCITTAFARHGVGRFYSVKNSAPSAPTWGGGLFLH